MYVVPLLVIFFTGYRYEPEVCNSCHDMSMMAFELENIAILNIKCVDYRSAVWNISKSDAVNRLNDYKLDVNDSL